MKRVRGMLWAGTLVWLRCVERLALLVGFLALTGILPANVRAATTTITTCDQASLDSAMSSASSGDTIAFGCNGVIALTHTLSFTKDLTLDGTGQSVTLDGLSSVQVINVSSGVHLTLNNLTITRGNSFTGGGLYTNGGIVTILNSNFTGNHASYGGGILNQGGSSSLTVTNSTFTGNSADFTGGGLNSGGTLTISNSTVANNSGPYAAGGIENFSGTLTITNSTITNNSTSSVGGGRGGGGIWTNSTTSLTNSTVVNNSGTIGDGGIRNEGSALTIGGTIIANNTGGNCLGTVNTDSGYNLESGLDCGFTGTGDLQNTNPLLDTNGLRNNGGPTQTIALQQGSPAIDAGGSSCPSTDQRGITRKDNAETTCDIGAYEYQDVVAVCVAPPSGLVGWWPGDGNANDIIGGNNGTLENGATFATGEVGQAFSFNGVAADVRVPHNINQNTGGQISVDAWIWMPNPLSGFTTASIINKRSSSDVEGYTFELVNGYTGLGGINNGLQFEITTTSGQFLRAIVGNVIGPRQWYHVAGTYDGSMIRIFVNGTQVATGSASGSILPVTDDLVIGRNIVNGGSFPGLIDEVELFNRALTLAEIQGIYNARSAGKCKPTQTTLSVAAVTATFGGTANLQATLKRASDNSAVSGKTISFTLNGNAAVTATTDTSGVATLTGVSLGIINPGTYPTGIGASFTADTTFAASSGTAQLTINQAPAITSPNSTTFIVGTAGSFTLTATGFPAPTLSESGALPSGVTFNAATGALSGTPGPNTGGTYGIQFMAGNGIGSNAVQNFTLTVNQAPAITSANSTTFNVGTAGSFTVTATGFPAPTLSESGALPTGVTFNAATHVLSGTPAVGTGGTYNISFMASNGVGTNAMQSFTLTVLGSAVPRITSPNSTTFTVGVAGSFTVTATGSPVPTLSRTGALPSGVTFNAATGVLSGTPAAGTGRTYNLTFTARNGIAPNAVQSFTLTVRQAPAITSAASATFTVGTARSFTVRATGFPAPTLSELGALPSGVTFNAATRVLSGTPGPNTGGIYSIQFTASNGVGADAVQSFTLTVRQAPAITSANSTTFTVGTAGTFTVTATGFPVPTLSRTGALPSGVTFNAATGVLSGTPAAGTRGIRNITFRARNGVAPPAVQAFTLTVN